MNNSVVPIWSSSRRHNQMSEIGKVYMINTIGQCYGIYNRIGNKSSNTIGVVLSRSISDIGLPKNESSLVSHIGDYI